MHGTNALGFLSVARGVRSETEVSRGGRLEGGRRCAVAGPVFFAVRGMLAQREGWNDVREAFVRRRPQDAGWIDKPSWSMWVALDRHVDLVEAAVEVMGIEGIHEVGRERLAEDLRDGPLANIVRSWLRTFADSPSRLLRVAPYLWRAGFRDCGDMVVDDVQEQALRFKLMHAPERLRASEAWRTLLAGFGQGLLELAQVEGGKVRFVTMDDSSEDVGIVLSWHPGRAR